MATDTPLEQMWDVIVIRTGAAALTSALSAVAALLVDKCPDSWAGGNGSFTAGAYRTQHNGLKDLLPIVSNVTPEMERKIDLPVYSAHDFHGDLQRLSEGRSSRVLARRIRSKARGTPYNTGDMLSAAITVGATPVGDFITFTFFGGLAITPENAGVLREDGSEIEGLHCAGEMVGGLFYGNYPGGSGPTAGAVFGRRAGRAAAETALRSNKTAKL